MPELPDIVVYTEALATRLVGRPLKAIRLLNPFLLRTASPSVESLLGKRITGVTRMGKRIVIALEGDLFMVLHLMIAGRLRWLPQTARPPGRISLAAFEFADGQLVFTEAGTKRRASLHLIQGLAGVATLDPGGIDVQTASTALFAQRLTAENHTLKRVLTDPHVLSGIGNAYSDEILHRAQLSPIAHSQKLTAEQIGRLHAATKAVLNEWTERLRTEAGEKFPEGVTAFRPAIAAEAAARSAYISAP